MAFHLPDYFRTLTTSHYTNQESTKHQTQASPTIQAHALSRYLRHNMITSIAFGAFSELPSLQFLSVKIVHFNWHFVMKMRCGPICMLILPGQAWYDRDLSFNSIQQLSAGLFGNLTALLQLCVQSFVCGGGGGGLICVIIASSPAVFYLRLY